MTKLTKIIWMRTFMMVTIIINSCHDIFHRLLQKFQLETRITLQIHQILMASLSLPFRLIGTRLKIQRGLSLQSNQNQLQNLYRFIMNLVRNQRGLSLQSNQNQLPNLLQSNQNQLLHLEARVVHAPPLLKAGFVLAFCIHSQLLYRNLRM